MKKAKFISAALVVALFIISSVVSCKKHEQINEAQSSPNLPASPYDYMGKHSVNSNLATLGRVLFFDKSLSVNNAVSCGSCHKQEFAFANNVRFDKGFNGLSLTRNSPSIQGINGFAPLFTFGFDSLGMPIPMLNDSSGMPSAVNQLPVLLFWDGRQRNLADMVLNPVLNHNEMNVPDFESLVSKLSAIAYYPDLFKKAFGDEAITKERIAFAIEGFVSCLNTGESVTQVQVRQRSLTEFEEAGRSLFHNKYNCAKCHDNKPGRGVLLEDPSQPGRIVDGPGIYGNPTDPSQMFNIGLDQVYADKGLRRITGLPGDEGVFKVPTLQNIAVTAPYMHDGRFSNLGEVLDHYSHGVQPNSNLSPLFKNIDGTPKKLNISPIEKSAIIAFLNTLTNEDFLTSSMYSDPFKK